MTEREQTIQRIREERESQTRPYFSIFKGMPVRRSELPSYTLEATEVLIKAGKFIEQYQLDGDSLIYLNGTPKETKDNS